MIKDIHRREFLNLLASGAAIGVLSGFTSGCSKQTKKTGGNRKSNILFLFTDDQRFDTIHALGNKNIITPNMDSLVHNGVSFTRAYIMGSTVGAVCAPSRAMLLTGRTLFHVPDSIIQPSRVPESKRFKCPYITFPELFRNEGYITFGTGKWHNGSPLFAKGFTTGANIFYGGMSNHLKVPIHDFDPTGEYPKEKRYIGEKFSSELFSDAAVEFIHEFNDDNPFLMYISYTAPHDPRMAPQKYKDMYNPEKIPLPKNFMPEHPFDNGELKIRDENLAPFPRTPDIVREHIADYYAMITHLDEQIGRVLKALEKSGHADNTIIVFSGDNGLAVGQHGLLGKQNLYEHSVRVPLIISGPGILKEETHSALCYLSDIFPTICELCGIPIPETVEGKSLVPLIMGGKKKIRDSVFGAYKEFQRMVRDERYKLIEYNVNGKKTTQLFNLINDPEELNNLSADPNYSEQLTRIRKEFAKWQEKVDDPWLDDKSD